MLVTVGKLSIDFNENTEAMERKLEELKRLEKAIEQSPYFKLLSGKTQMIGKGKGKVIKERSRRVHSSNIAQEVVLPAVSKIYDRFKEETPIFVEDPKYKRIFELNRNIAITRGMIMAKAHDIGHVPFGHEGEKAINDFFSSINNVEDMNAILKEHLKYFGKDYEIAQGHIDEVNIDTILIDELFPLQLDTQLSFEHNELGAILLNRIIEENKIELTDGQTNWDEEYDVSHPKNAERKALTMGVLGHSTTRTPLRLLEGDVVAQIVRVGDKIEYINADYDEIAGLVNVNFNVEQQIYMNKTTFDRINETVEKILNEAFNGGEISEDTQTMLNLQKIRKEYEDVIYIYDGVYADNLLRSLLSLYDKPEELEVFYKQNRGVENLYPKENLDMLVNYKKILEKVKSGEIKLSMHTLEKMHKNADKKQVYFKGAIQGENCARISLITLKVMRYYYNHPTEIPAQVSRKVNPIDLVPADEITYTLHSEYSPAQKTLEYVSLMDDKALQDEYIKLVRKRIEQGKGFGVEPINMKEVKRNLRKDYEEAVYMYIKDIAGSGSRTFSEGQKLYAAKYKFHEEKDLTHKGRYVKKENSSDIWKEYDEDKELYREMLERDAERNSKNIIVQNSTDEKLSLNEETPKKLGNYFNGQKSDEVKKAEMSSKSGSADNGVDYGNR